MIRRPLCALVVLLLFGCKAPPPEAPTDLGELAVYLYREFDNPEPAAMAAGLRNLDEFLGALEWTELDSSSSREGREWQLPVLAPEDRADLPEIEGASAEDQLVVGVASRSVFGVSEHLPLVGMADQTPIEAASSASYDRDFLSELDCFVEGNCDQLRTLNTVHRDQLLLDIVYESFKDFRRFEADADAGTVLVARSWTEDRFFGESGQNSIDQSYSLEVWLPRDEGALRFMTYWNQMTIPALSDSNIVLNLMGAGMDEIYQNTEDFLAGEGD
ncbi:MAG: hypothetical protein VX498_11505 [Myxococcota bacterium]|nr:hypothetical protein [Myxococcota bacterium]